MANKIFIPTPLRPFTNKQESVEVEGSTIGELLADLTKKYEGLRQHLYTDEGRLRSFVNIYINDEDIRYLDKERTQVRAGDTISIIPSVAGGTVDVAPEPMLSNDEVRRYSRHLIMPEVGMDGQRKLKAGKVLCIGAGGLGSPAALYLAAAGVGTIGIVDFDEVDYSNLQRQILHGTPDVGRSKLHSAKDRLTALNPHVNIVTYETALTSKNALDLFKGYDVILDGTDNFPTRYLVNDACVLLGIPNAYGSIFRFEGQASVFAAKNGPCYRCLYPEPPPPGLVPSCAEGGVLGVLPGVIGTIQATEAIKLIIGVGEPLVGRFLIYDALRMRFRELKLRKDPDCPVCGTHPTVRELIDYEQFCGVAPTPPAQPLHTGTPTGTPSAAAWLGTPAASEREMTVEELKQKMDAHERNLIVVDVREPQEFQICRIPGTVLMPLGDVPRRVGELDKTKEIVVHCKSGVRSAKAAEFLRSAGFPRVKNLTGGILAWIDRIDPSQPKY